MQRNVLIFHGTSGSPQGNWFPWLKEKLQTEGYQVFILRFPNPETPSFTNWYTEFEKYKKFINENTILIGHSLGGLFLLRVLERLENPISAAFFVVTSIGVKPIRYYDSGYRFSGFSFDWEEIIKKAKLFTVYHSDNDPYVSIRNGKELAKHLGITLTFIPNAGHLNAESRYTEFDKLFDDIRKLML